MFMTSTPSQRCLSTNGVVAAISHGHPQFKWRSKEGTIEDCAVLSLATENVGLKIYIFKILLLCPQFFAVLQRNECLPDNGKHLLNKFATLDMSPFTDTFYVE
jgi:hypothetical protein